MTPAEPTRPTDDELLAVAEAAARAAAPELLTRFAAGGLRVATKSTATDPVTEADIAAEQAIRAELTRLRPDDALMGEEGDDVPGTSGLRWIIDPIDGTVDYLYGHPQWCVSVACEGRAGVVLDPVREELWAATAEPGSATLNGEAITAPSPDGLGATLVGTGFGYDAAIRTRQAAILTRVLPAVRDIRRAGAAALDLAWTAAGRLDAYYEHGVKAWDIAAGTLLCEAVGLRVVTLDGGDGLPPGVLVAPPHLADELLALVLGD